MERIEDMDQSKTMNWRAKGEVIGGVRKPITSHFCETPSPLIEMDCN
jgi:hypothetical protein